MPDSWLPLWAQVVVPIISLLIGGAGGGWILSVFRERRQANREDKKEESSTAFEIYKEIISALQTDRQNLISQIDKYEKDHNEAVSSLSKHMAENASLKTKIEFLEIEIKDLKIQIEELKGQTSVLKDASFQNCQK